LSLATSPDLSGARTAIGGGPHLVHQARRLELPRPITKGRWPHEFAAMRERHPRTALGWNDRYLYLVVVDGRQRKLSRGMTLSELADYLIGLGCQEAINLDGGGSSTLWCNGRVLNSPSDGWEREVANALVVVRHPETSRRLEAKNQRRD
jgi:exopolysaccharide biosynthesis protein